MTTRTVRLVGGPHPGATVTVFGKTIACLCHREGWYTIEFDADLNLTTKWRRFKPLQATR